MDGSENLSKIDPAKMSNSSDSGHLLSSASMLFSNGNGNINNNAYGNGGTHETQGCEERKKCEPQQPKPLPSYLALACSINGYSTTTNYDSVRLSKSREASPHRFPVDGTEQSSYSNANFVYTIPANQGAGNNSFLAVPLPPTHPKPAGDNLPPTSGSCLVSHSVMQEGDNHKCEATSNTTPQKSFIEQRVERLYGPGALAQGFYTSPRMGRHLHNATPPTSTSSNGCMHQLRTHSQSGANAVNSPQIDPSSLPVLRHLRPEFRAQLPSFISSKKSTTHKQVTNANKSIEDVDTIDKVEQLDVHTIALEKLALEKDTGRCVDEASNNGLHPKHTALDCRATTDCSGVTEKPEQHKHRTDIKDGHYFLHILAEESDRLLKLADKFEQVLNEESEKKLSEEIVGKIRSATGKARLLVTQKIQQFKGLCTNNITQDASEAFPTTNEDLQGFWDMVMLQVNQVDLLFSELDALKRNKWIERKSPELCRLNGRSYSSSLEGGRNTRTSPSIGNNYTKTQRISSTSISKPRVSSANDQARQQQRKQLIEQRRRAMKAASDSSGAQSAIENVQFFVPK